MTNAVAIAVPPSCRRPVRKDPIRPLCLHPILRDVPQSLHHTLPRTEGRQGSACGAAAPDLP